jgi:dTDP-4-amino-4,6-dideoxygalactose transaminase
MKRSVGPSEFRFPVVRPAFPTPEEWSPYLKQSYDLHWFSNFGPAVTRFETALTAEFGERGDAFVATSNATAALTACLIADRISGIVLVPAFTFAASAGAVRMAGAEPMLVDVDPVTWACDVHKLAQALDRTNAEAVMLVAPFGITQDFSEHVALCRSRGVAVVIDNAAGLGGGPRSRRSLRGTAHEVFSLHATKPFGIGEGGLIHAAADRVNALRSAINFGFPHDPKRSGAGWGINGKMPEFSAAAGLAVLDRYAGVLTFRRAQARRYMELFARFGDIAIHRGLDDTPWSMFPCLMPSAAAAEDVVGEAGGRGLELRRYFRPSLSRWGGIRAAADCSVSEMLAERMICLPVYSRATQEEIAEMHSIVETCLIRLVKLAA